MTCMYSICRMQEMGAERFVEHSPAIKTEHQLS